MGSKIQAVPGYYVWDVPGQAAAVYLSLDTLDRLEAEVLRGFGAMPKRGAEVGGILLGATELGPGGRAIVRIRDFEPVACAYKRGPTYLLDEEESQNFQQAFEHWKSDPSRPVGAVGYYRSNTRDDDGPDAEDIARVDQNFPEPEAVILLVRPNATKPSTAGFLMRENGSFPAVPPAEFPFRRRDLAGVEPALRQQTMERASQAGYSEDNADPAEESGQNRRPRRRRPAILSTAEARAQGEPPSKFRATWVWIPLSFVFLLLGVFLGFQFGVSLSPRFSTTSAAASDFSLGLTVTPAEDNLNVRWNRDAPAVRTAQKGVLEIEDGGYTKPVDLDQAHLQNGSVIYRHTSNTVRFRLTVYVGPRSNLTETLDWRQ